MYLQLIKILPGLKHNVQIVHILHLHILAFIIEAWLLSGPGNKPFGDHAPSWRTQAGAVPPAQPVPVPAQPSPLTHTHKSQWVVYCALQPTGAQAASPVIWVLFLVKANKVFTDFFFPVSKYHCLAQTCCQILFWSCVCLFFFFLFRLEITKSRTHSYVEIILIIFSTAYPQNVCMWCLSSRYRTLVTVNSRTKSCLFYRELCKVPVWAGACDGSVLGVRGRRVRKDRRAQQLESVLCINDDNEQNCPKITLWSPRGASGPLGTIHGMQQVLAHPSAHVEGGWEKLEPAEGMPQWQQLGPLLLGWLHRGKKHPCNSPDLSRWVPYCDASGHRSLQPFSTMHKWSS